MRHPRALAIQVERCGNELPHLVPVIRQLQIRQVNREENRCECAEENDRGVFAEHARLLNHRTARVRLQFDLSERGFVLRHVLLQDIRKRFGLLRA